jgi:restriction modification system DNA specificity domain protein
LDGAEVEWRTLGEVSELRNTGVDKKINESEKSIRLLNFTDVFNNQYLSNSTPTMIVTASDKKIIDCNILKGDLFITPTSEILDEIGQSAVALENIDNAVYSYHIMRIRIHDTNFLLPEFLNYLFRTSQIKQQIRKNAQGITRFGLTLPRWKSLVIPIPPLSVQTEIVKILDALTALTSELTSELTLRRKQYEYYREKLLSEEELEKVGFEWRTLEELVEKTQNIKWKNNTKTYRYIDLTSVDRENNSITGTIEINALNAPSRAQKIVKENDIIFATTRPTQQRIASITKEFSGEIASTGYCVLRANTDIVLPKWLFYFLSTINFKNYVEENQSGSAYPAISDSKVKEFRIPVPDVTIQQSIIEKLDKFYGLTNSLLHGLPKEINNRTKQYLYYQEELLNFKGEDL